MPRSVMTARIRTAALVAGGLGVAVAGLGLGPLGSTNEATVDDDGTIREAIDASGLEHFESLSLIHI